MSKKHKKHQAPAFSSADLKGRVEKAVREGRFQQALELARQLYKYESTPAHLELLKSVSLGRAKQLREQNYTRDALTTLETARQLDPANPTWLRQLAEALALCGGVIQSLTLLQELPDGDNAKILGPVADAALLQGSGRNQLPAASQADHDRILQAFREVEAGQDEQAKATLQGIGLRSPFLEWKVFLRGLLAYYQKDDVRAVENWQRLAAERLPFRLAAPFRCQIDAAYKAAQPPAAQNALQQQLAQLHPSTLAQQLRQLRTAMANKQHLANAYRQAEALLPQLRQQAPHLVPRLAACFYWAALDSGPDDIMRYQRIFGAPPDDPHFHRLRALAYEKVDRLQDAQKSWEQYQQEIATLTKVFPGEQSKRARALVWLHMGNNAALAPSAKKLKQLPPFLRDHPSRPRPLEPSVEKCLQHSLELAPDLLEAHQALFHYHQEEEHAAKALKVGQQLLQRFPDHIPSLVAVAELLEQNDKPAEALSLLQRALKNNPLNRELRFQVTTAHLLCARTEAEDGHFDAARQEYQAALDLDTRANKSGPLCKWAACEFKAGDTARAEELIQQARSQNPSALDVSYKMLIEVIRLKLPRALKLRFEKEYKEGLAAPPTTGDIVALLETALDHESAGVNYQGRKTHTKQILTYTEKARSKVEFSEAQLVRVCEMLIGLKATVRCIDAYLKLGLDLFENNPHFPYLNAKQQLSRHPDFPPPQVSYHLREAERLAQKLPRSPEQEDLLKQIDALKQALQLANPFAGGFMMPDFFDLFGGGPDEDEDDEDYY